MPSAVFLSYASQDASAATRIRDALQAAGIEVWFDQSELRGGDAWDAKIRRQIKECALFIAVISANTQGRPEGYFRLEWRLAEQRTHLMGKTRAFLLPVCVDTTSDATADVPDSFLNVQWTRLSGGQTPASFTSQVRELLGKQTQGPGHLVTEPSERRPSPPSPTTGGASVAVLAFANLSNDKENEYFSDGISEELLNVLSKIPNLKVSARTSAFHFKGRDTPIPEIARILGVTYVVEGSVRKSGDRVRITAQLIKASDGFHVWSDTFTRDLKDIFAVQDEIAGLIARSLSLKLVTPAHTKKVDPEAYRLFLQGRAILNREIPDEFPKAIECYQASLALDGNAALTWACLSQAYNLASGSGSTAHTSYQLAREAAERSIALDPELAKGHGALAMVLIVHDWDWRRARAEMDRAFELAPGDAEMVSYQAVLAGVLGHTEQAVALGRQAVELDPMNFFAGYSLVRSLFNLRDYNEVAKQVGYLTSLNHSGFRLRLFQGAGYLFMGRHAEAAAVIEKLTIEWARLTGMACLRFAEGKVAESDALLDEFKARHSKSSAFQVAEVYAFRNQAEECFEWLEISYRQRDPGTALLKCDPFFTSMYSDSRWQPFLRKMNLADDQLAFLSK